MTWRLHGIMVSKVPSTYFKLRLPRPRGFRNNEDVRHVVILLNRTSIFDWYTLTSVMSLPLLHVETLENGCAQFKYPSLLSHFLPICHMFLTFKQSTKELKPHTHVHHDIIIVIIAMLTSCYSTMSRVTLILYYHDASMITLQISLISRALWLPHA